ncbi:MAG TPA: RNA 2',3'-cyclic phosphodiesterase [Candidatus Acidoferrales bacterium]|nr:RNA 2',3'-cyclic phosphodiesterase [Candidatus Acidoferrales bacterium]
MIESKRLFVAIDIPENVRSSLGELMKSLRDTCRDARWARITGLHVTLKFIGETPSERVADMKSALAKIPTRDPIAIDFSGVGFFPNARRPRVFWAGVEAGPELASLANAVEKALGSEAIPQEDRKFSPHITLARFKDAAGVDALQVAIEKAGPLKFGGATATEFHLYQSVLKPGGAEYTRLATFSFCGSKSK